MVCSGVHVRVCLALAAAMALSPACLLGQAFDAPGPQSADNSSQKTEDWPGQVRAYTEWRSEAVTASDQRANLRYGPRGKVQTES